VGVQQTDQLLRRVELLWTTLKIIVTLRATGYG
jgi:hypothetical protein